MVESRVLQTLESSRLNRVGLNFDLIKIPIEEHDWSGEYHPVDSPMNVARSVSFDVPGGLTREDIKNFPFVVDATVVHEGGHALWDLVPFIRDDVKVFKHRVEIEKVLDLFRPYLSLERYFRPEGEFYSKMDIKKTSVTTSIWDQRYRNINMSTVTDYASWVYTLWADGNTVMDFINVLNQDPRSFSTDNQFLYRLFPDNYNPKEPRTEPKEFGEFWDGLISNIKKSDLKPNVFEQMIIDEISKDPRLFESKERQVYIIRNNWQYLYFDVIPLVATQLYLRNPEVFMGNFLAAVKRPECELALMQSAENVFLTLANKRADPLNGFERGDCAADSEQFAEIVAYNYLRKKDGVKNEIGSDIWDQVDKAINGLIDDLVSDGLALVPSETPKM